MKGSRTAALVMATVWAVSACALLEPQDQQNAALADLSNRTSPSSNSDSRLIGAQAHASVSENHAIGEAGESTVPSDQPINDSSPADSAPKPIEVRANVPASKKTNVGKKSGKTAAATPATPRDQYFASLFSITIDDLQWKKEIGQCAVSTYARHMRILNKGMKQEIAKAASKAEAAKIKKVLGQLDDPLLFKANCIKNLLVMMYGTNNLPAIAPQPAKMQPKDQMPKDQTVEWTFPINEVQARRKGLGKQALIVIGKKFHDSFAGPGLATDEMYPFIKELWLDAHKSFKVDVNDVSKPSGEASALAGPALLHRGIYIKLAGSKKYSAGVVRTSHAPGTEADKPNSARPPVKKK